MGAVTPAHRYTVRTMALLDYQRAFLDFAISLDVLRFGEFTLKSGRKSPYFFNSGLFNTGRSIGRLGYFYAAAIEHSALAYDMVFGPSYKGIPLAVSTVIALSTHFQSDVPYAFNRKEIKDHGEGGAVVGANLRGRCLVIDDVISAGTSVRESVSLITGHGAILAGVVIALDRQERGLGELSAIAEIEQEFGIPVASIVCFEDVIAYMEEKGGYDGIIQRMHEYRRQYGA